MGLLLSLLVHPKAKCLDAMKSMMRSQKGEEQTQLEGIRVGMHRIGLLVGNRQHGQ